MRIDNPKGGWAIRDKMKGFKRALQFAYPEIQFKSDWIPKGTTLLAQKIQYIDAECALI